MNRNTTYWLILLIIIAIAGGGLYYQYQDTRPCVHPIPYAIGAVDPRFGIENATLVSDVETAAAIWNKEAGKIVLAYDPNAALKINLVYDAREANAKLGNEIATQQATLDAQRQLLGSNPTSAQVASYNASVDALNAMVRQYNQSAGQTFREGEYVRDSAGERINIFEFIGHIQLERVLAHEFGHALDLGHNNDPKSIMYAENESGNLVPTKADLAALQTVCGN